MAIEMEDFLYELKNHVEQTHTFKDAFERLTPEEQNKVAELAPSGWLMPPKEQQTIIDWLEQMQIEFGITE
ncbi:hypothetical protein [Lentibacillus jeotgali]|uniref:hypothetical protein n=1 Tax=Lentibacillus jeotgali TaxID=558169 RepID=UPI000262643A|nr:hypothetical protein [Lentibacillus jeotgali]